MIMPRSRYEATLSVKSINALVDKINAYADNLPTLCNKALKRLADKGIRVAEQNKGLYGRYGTHQFENYVGFEKRIEGDSVLVVGFNYMSFFSSWIDSDGNPHATDISPIAMIEFGSAIYALPQQSVGSSNVGKGSLAVRGNENKSDWYFTDADGNKKVGTAITPSRPLYQAAQEMYREVENTFKEVFREAR